MRSLNFVLPRVIIFLLFLWLLAMILFFIVESATAQDEIDYIEIAVDYYLKSSECFAYNIVANGLVYFLTPTGQDKQIGEYTDIESYLQAGVEYIEKACK